MATFRVQMTLPMDSGLPADAVVNTLHFTTALLVIGPAQFDNVVDMIDDFWNNIPTGGTTSPAAYFPATVGPNMSIEFYDLGDPKPRVPKYQKSIAITSSVSGVSLPSEVALCLSFQADRESGASQARRRNRIYIGPLSTFTVASDGRPTTALIDNLRRAAKDLLNAADASINWEWAVYSPTNDETYNIANGWVDNAWDSQRRRGLKATSRNPWSDVLPS